MTRLTATKAREEFSEVLNRVAYGHERIVLHRHGKDLAVIVPVEDAQLLELLLEKEEEQQDKLDIEKALKEETFSWEGVKREAGL